MGVVYHPRDLSCLAHEVIKTPFGCFYGAERGEGFHGILPQQHCGAIYRQQVIGIECADQASMDLLAIDIQQDARQSVFQDFPFKIGHLQQAVAIYFGPGILDHDHSALVVGIDQCKRPLGQLVEEAFFGAYILVKGLVVIQMVVGNIGKNRTCEDQSCDALLVHGMGAHLHKCKITTGSHHLGQQAVELYCVRRGISSGHDQVPDPIFDGGEESAFVPQRTKEPKEEGDRSRLAVGARDADQFQGRRRVAIEHARCLPQGLGAVGHTDIGHLGM